MTQRSVRLHTLLTTSAVLLAACETAHVPTQPELASAVAGTASARNGGAFAFTSLLASAACSVSGGDAVNPFVLPAGYGQTIIASEPSFADAIDMNTQNETGPDRGRYLYRPTEGSIGEVSVTDLETGVTRRLAFRPDWESFDMIAWTPWGTLIVGEEANVQSRRDPEYPGAIGGLVYEIFFAPGDLTTAERIVARPALGSKAQEGNRFDRNGNLYSISESNPGFIYKFVPDVKGDLSSGQLYALRIVNDLGDRTGDAEWIPLDRAAVQVDARDAALAAGATGYNRPEDVEIATSSGNNRGGSNVLYVAVTGRTVPVDNRIIAVDLREPDGARDHATAFVYDYVKWGVNATTEFEMPDNLALDQQGNLYIAEDPGGSFPSKRTGDDIWAAAPGSGPHAPASSVSRFASLTDCDAEPTGIYFDVTSDRLFVNVQHRGGDRLDKAVAIDRLP
ncbi:MAG TPA: alkaline phosphatase PhoX [Gemmatimonadaceae bacterium]|nr:alkaline phosphatase PhoX [Gemmatimonadaceae bacterium]